MIQIVAHHLSRKAHLLKPMYVPHFHYAEHSFGYKHLKHSASSPSTIGSINQYMHDKWSIVMVDNHQ